MEVRYFESSEGRRPVEEFIDDLSNKQKSIVFTFLHMLSASEGLLRMPYSKRLTKELYELRPSAGGTEIRLVYFFHEGAAIVVGGFVKKSRKTPLRELKLARSRRADYLNREENR